MSAALRASMRKSSSSRRRSANSVVSSTTPYSAPHVVRSSTVWASWSSTSEIALDRVGDTGPLDLHDDGLPVVQRRPVRLPDRGRRHRLPVEFGEDLVDRLPQLLFDQLAHGVGRRGRHVVLEVRELLGDRRRHQVGTGREHLAHLHEHPAALFERVPQRGAPAAPGRRSDSSSWRRSPSPGPRPLRDRDARDLGVAAHPLPPPAQRVERPRDRREPALRAGAARRDARAARAIRTPTSRPAPRTGTRCAVKPLAGSARSLAMANEIASPPPQPSSAAATVVPHDRRTPSSLPVIQERTMTPGSVRKSVRLTRSRSESAASNGSCQLRRRGRALPAPG